MTTPQLSSENFNNILEQLIEQEKSDSPSTVIENKLEEMSLTNGWNDKNETMVISIGENAASYKWMHEKTGKFYKFINQIFSIILIVFSTGLSAETIIPSDTNDNPIVNILRSAFTYIVTLVSVLQNFLKYEKLAEQHFTFSNSFGELYRNIQHQMCMYRKDRILAKTYISTILKQYDNLIVNGPTIPEYMVKKFKNTFKNTDIAIPDIADRIQKIEIITEPISENRNQSNNKNINLLNYSSNNIRENEKDKISPVLNPQTTKNLGRYGVCNLQQIHNAFQIHGDISDQNVIELKELKKKHSDAVLDFEMERFKQHEK